MFNRNPKGKLDWSEVRDLPSRPQLFTEPNVLLWGVHNGENVIDMDHKDDSAGRCVTDVDAPFA